MRCRDVSEIFITQSSRTFRFFDVAPARAAAGSSGSHIWHASVLLNGKDDLGRYVFAPWIPSCGPWQFITKEDSEALTNAWDPGAVLQGKRIEFAGVSFLADVLDHGGVGPNRIDMCNLFPFQDAKQTECLERLCEISCCLCKHPSLGDSTHQVSH